METSSRSSRLGYYGNSLCLAYQSLGIVYGDLSTSPIYVFKSAFSGRMQLYEDDHEILGVLSLVFWTLTLVPLFKYVVFVISADDNGEGGTFALYSLLCRNSRIGLIHASEGGGDGQMSAFSIPDSSAKKTKTSSAIRDFFERHQSSRVFLLLVVLLGTSMVISDGILTPAMSVLSAVYGIKIKVPHLHDDYTIVVACIILVVLFALQHNGTKKVGFLFAPILIAWLISIAGIGVYNIIHWNPDVVNAISPWYVVNYFKKTGKTGWHSLGGVVLCVTGAEAMFADLGHFSQLSIRIAFSGFVYPCLVLAYMGEAAYLSKHKEDLQSSFYKAVPEVVFWPFFIVATLATIVASQAVISATFSIVGQCRALRCFARVRIIHTSNNIHGQIYIPEVNWILMLLCLAVTLGFRDTNKIGNAYGLAVTSVMFVSTCLMFLVITTVWKRNILMALAFVTFFGSIELSYLSACVVKVHEGGWVPLVSSFIIMILMMVWKYGTVNKHKYEMENKVCLDRFLNLSPSLGITRVPGIVFVYSNVLSGIPTMFAHFVTNFPAFHEVLSFVTLETIMVPKVPASERFVVSRVGPPSLYMFRCIVRYGYKDVNDTYNFESQLIEKIAEFLQNGGPYVDGENATATATTTSITTISDWSPSHTTTVSTDQLEENGDEIILSDNQKSKTRRRVRFKDLESSDGGDSDVEKLMEARESGVSYMIGNVYVKASETSSFVKKIAVNIIYGFLRQNCRKPDSALGVPHTSLIEVGMAYYV